MFVSTSAGTQGETGADHQAVTALKQIKRIEASPPKAGPPCRFPAKSPSISRQQASLREIPFDLSAPIDVSLPGKLEAPETVLYLAYGSNLCAETFLGKRGIRPLSQINVVVPELVMTFDLAGLPYTEPCFANTAYRSLSPSTPSHPSASPFSEKTSLLPTASTSRPHWPKGLVGVVYEVTLADFAHIIATEGGGSSYQDVLVDCYTLPHETPSVPLHPRSTPFRAHTLFSPTTPPGDPPPKHGGRISRPDPEYAQPSARYLKLITDGADEHGLPGEYKTYLHALQPYTITTNAQRLGRYIFMGVWAPLVMAVFALGSLFQDEHGKSPGWLVRLTGVLFRAVWTSYDGVFKGVFGDGERTAVEGGGGEEKRKRKRRKLVKKVRFSAGREKGIDV